MVKNGTKRSDIDIFKIVTTAQMGIKYGNMGYVDDLAYYQGEDSIFKAQQIATRMSKEKGEELIRLVRESNAKMEESAWGGLRPGAGRKPSGRKSVNFYITEDEKEQLKSYLDELRGSKSDE